MLIDDIALTLQQGLGSRGIVHLLSTFEDSNEIYESSEAKLVTKSGLRADIAHQIVLKTFHRQAEEELEYMRRHGIGAVSSTNKEYPELLRYCNDYPHVLYYRGNRKVLGSKHKIAFVGTRTASAYGLSMCEILLQRLAEICPEAVVVSGMAYGIDSHIHRAALNAKLKTIGVIANPLPDIYPAQHQRLAEDIIASGGAIVTELHSKIHMNGAYFIPRNRIIAGMSEGTVVVESPLKGGSIATAGFADSYHRVVMAVPGRVTDKCSVGCNRLIVEQRAAMVCSADDIVRELGWDIEIPGNIPARKDVEPLLTSDEKLIVKCLSENNAAGMDMLAVKTGIPVGQISSILMNMEISGIIRSLPGKNYELV